jgi:hypothetical protein
LELGTSAVDLPYSSSSREPVFRPCEPRATPTTFEGANEMFRTDAASPLPGWSYERRRLGATEARKREGVARCARICPEAAHSCNSSCSWYRFQMPAQSSIHFLSTFYPLSIHFLSRFSMQSRLNTGRFPRTFVDSVVFLAASKNSQFTDDAIDRQAGSTTFRQRTEST